MTEDNKHREAPSEDIDLLLLVERAILFFRRYRWVFIIAIILGLGTGFYFYKKTAKTYKSQLLVHSFLLTNLEEIQIVKTWNELLGKKEFPALSAILHCDEKILYKVKKIKASELQKVFSQQNPNGFLVEVVVTDNAVLDDLQTGIVYGFENNVYVKKRLDVKKAGLQELINKTDKEIRKLDSTKKIIEGIIGGKGTGSSSLIIDGSSVNRQLIEMNEKLIILKESHQYTNAVQVLQDFAKFSKPAGPHLLPWLVIGLVPFLGIAYIFALVSSIRRGLRTREQQRGKSKTQTG